MPEETTSGSPTLQPQPPEGTGGWWSWFKLALAGSDQEDFTRGSINRAVFLLAIPMMIEMAGESLFAVVDAYFVTRLGAAALSTVGLTESLLYIVYSVAVGLAMATTALVARRIGEGDPERASRAAAQAIGTSVTITVILGGLGIMAAPRLLLLLGANEEIVAVGSGYTRIMLGGMVTVMLLFVINAAFRGAGDASIAMRALWIANLTNIVLDPCLIFGWGPFPELGLPGAAVATTTGRGIGVAYQVVQLTRGRGRLAPRFRDFIPRWMIVRSLLKVASGGISQNLVATASWIFLVRIMTRWGADALGGYVLAIRIVVFALLPAWGLSNAAATLVGQNLGAGKPDRAERSVWRTGAFNMTFLGLVSLLFFLRSEWVVGLFSPPDAVAGYAAECLRVLAYGYVFYAWEMVMVQSFNGAGDTATPTWINLGCFWAFQIPLAWYLSGQAGWGPSGVFWAITISYAVSTVVAMTLFRRGRWKLKQV